MSWLSTFLGTATTAAPVKDAVEGALNGIGDTAIKLRSAITGDIPPDKKAELGLHLADIEARLSETQNKVNEVEAGNASFFVAGWRPFIGWLGGLGIAYTVFIQPVGAWLSVNYHWQAPPLIDTGALMTLVLGMLGIGTMRTVEKIQGVHNEH